MRLHASPVLLALVVVFLAGVVVMVAWWREQDRRVVQEATRVLPARDREGGA